MNYDNLLNDLQKFMMIIPDNILSECVDGIIVNRKDRRKYKTLESKIEAIIHNKPCRVKLIDAIYNKYDGAKNIGSELSYNDIISSINENNCIPQIIYTLHRCCDDEFNKQHFNDLIESVPFQNTINNNWGKSRITDTQESSKASSNIVKENKHMNYYLGYIELRSTYYNFIPQYIYNKKDITELSKDNLEEKFPEYGSVNLGYKKFGDDAHEFLKSLRIDKVDDATDVKPCTSIYAIHFDESELDDNDNDRIRKKLDLQRLIENGEDLKNRIKPISSFGIFKIVTSQETNINDGSFSGMIFVNEKDYPANEYVLLEDGQSLFGPYKLQERSIDGEKYVRPDSGIQKYILDYYNEADYEIYAFEKHSYTHEIIYTDVALINHSPRHRDVIPDSLLLTKLTDTIDVKLLSSNPEEFERLYSTSPFLSDIPDEIRKTRIERIQTILQNTADFDEIKKKAVITLLNSNNYSIPEETIKNSDPYQKLQKECSDLQKDADELNEKIKSLTEEKKELEIAKNKLEENGANTNSAVINDESITQLESENKELKEKVSLIEDFEKMKKDFEKLKNDYNTEQIRYDTKVREVGDKQKELEEIKHNVEKFINNELKKPDTTQMLRTAFDPYISNAMIEAAGVYSSNSESDQYKTISEEMKRIDCVEIDRSSLIDKLVTGVQKFRNYSKNEILNMYICLSQNFLTVFSGEPGTGKTSICNILASSLGLKKFGENNNISKNRYVPVSVERGWSSKRDLIGYFNPLTKKYDRNNAKIYDGLMILNEERQESRFPYIILLDEANLSPIEYYWADFMRAADSNENNVFINIGLEKDIYIPKTLHFLATINNDQTTEELSPRLIDRAWIVRLPKYTEKISGIEVTDDIDKYFKDIVLWSDIENTFVVSESKEMSLKLLADQIYNLFDEHHLTVSPRVQQSIKNYVCVAQEIMEDEVDEVGVCNKKQKALDFAIVQKLLPKINGYYKDYERLFASLKQICDENHLIMTKNALLSMEEFKDQNMGYCKYLI
ncbi:MAG: hypothetical protein ACLSHR_13080 [Oscillospiraceae bacterium]